VSVMGNHTVKSTYQQGILLWRD